MAKKYRKLNCGPTSKQCGGTCISKGEDCHVGKASLLKQNVKKEINRLEQGKEPGAITNKAFAKLLVTDPDIGQKLPPEISPYIASSDKIDDRVKKSYFDSATRKSWNIDKSHGSRPAIKLKKQDEDFARKLNNRAKQNNVEATQGNEKEFEDKSKNFFKTDKGKRVLKLVAATATIGAAAAITAYGIKEGKSRVAAEKANNKTSVKEVVTRSYQKSPESVQVREDIRESMRQAGDKVSSDAIGDAPYVSPTPTETYANMYDRAKYLDKQVQSGVELSTREATDYKDSWGYEPGQRGTKGAKPDSKLGKAEKEAVDYIKKEAPNASDEEIKEGLDYLRNKKVYDDSKSGQTYDPNTKQWKSRKWTEESSYINEEDTAIQFDPETGKYEKKPLVQPVSDSQDVNPLDLDYDPVNKRRKEIGRAESSARNADAMQGSSENVAGLQDDEVDSRRKIERKKDNPLDKIGGSQQLPKEQVSEQIKDWDNLDKETQEIFARNEVLRDARGSSYGGDIIDGVPDAKKRAKNFVDEQLNDIYDSGTIGVLQQQKLGQIKTAITSGAPVLPQYRSDASVSIEDEIDLGPAKSGQVSDGVSIGDNLTDGLGTESGGKLTAKQRKQNELAAINPDIFKDVGEKYTKKTLANGAIVIRDSKGKRFKKKGDKLFIDGKEVTGADLQEKLRKMWQAFNFSELDEDLLVKDILEIRDNVMVIDSNEGLLSLIFDEDANITVIPF